MKCPVCNVDLQMAERQGVEIDYCPQCRGVWLDRGELDKIIERSAAFESRRDREGDEARNVYRERSKDDNEDYYRGKQRGRGGFLGDILGGFGGEGGD